MSLKVGFRIMFQAMARASIRAMTRTPQGLRFMLGLR